MSPVFLRLSLSCSRFDIKVQHTDASQQIQFRQVGVLVPAEGAIHQLVAILDIECQPADQGFLLFVWGDQVQPILVLRVQHDKLLSVEGQQSGLLR